MRFRRPLLALLAALGPAQATTRGQEPIDISKAVVLHGPGVDAEGGAGAFAAYEGEKRRLGWKALPTWGDANGRPVLAFGTRDKGLEWTGPFRERLAEGGWPEGPDGYRIEADPAVPAVIVVGNSDRGTLFGLGRAFRETRWGPGGATLPGEFRETSAPAVGLRGHQLGYRAKTNSYDAWDVRQWRRYIHELAVFGANAVELLPPRTDDDLDSPHFPLPPMAMLSEMSGICETLGLETWLWFPVMDRVDAEPGRVEPLLKEWEEVFRATRRLDAVFVPGGDPGSLPPAPLFAFLEKADAVLKKVHPKAGIWVSPQGFDSVRMAEFLELVKAEPKWLAGIVFGPQVRLDLGALREAIPARLPIRGYPDITHCRQCQHPVPDWDLAFAVTEGREPINPRPRAMASLVNAYKADTVGFITYSEGCNDDVNKAVWSALGWSPSADVTEVLRQYSRYFLGERYAEGFTQSLLGLERNWGGPLLVNAGVETTLSGLQAMEREASPELLLNWRFQQALYRAYYDADVRDRLIQETAQQERALDALRRAPETGSDLAMKGAIDAFAGTLPRGRRARVFELGEALFQSIGMQLSAPKYRAIASERGANLDTIDTPLNDRAWIAGQLETTVRPLRTEAERLKAVASIADRTHARPGGFYDDLGDMANSPRLVRTPSTDADPMFTRAAFQGFALRTDWPLAWRNYAQTYFDAPLSMRYDGLDPRAAYRVRVVYSGDSPRAQLRLVADGHEVHPYIDKPDPVMPLTFDVPKAATADGSLTLTWAQTQGRGGNGRGCQVAEVWLEPVGLWPEQR